jgi:ribosomal protein S18 acetylase RimI-like enzyme
MTGRIRPAGPQDLAAVEAIVRSAYAPYVPLIWREPGPMLDDYAASIGQGHVYLLSDEGGISGIIVLIPEERAMLLDNVAVRPDAQGRGHGRTLIGFAERMARERGLGAIRLYTNEAMTENVALYGRLGFVETHRAEERGFQRIYMTKRLDAPS